MKIKSLLLSCSIWLFLVPLQVNGSERSDKQLYLSSKLADYSYGESKLPSGFKDATNEDVGEIVGRIEQISGLKFENGRFFSNESGFSASLVKDRAGNFTLSYRGTVNRKDWDTNFELNSLAPQQTQAIYLAMKLRQATGGRLSLVGHSKGGNLAQYAGAMFDLPTTTFNSANLTSAQIKLLGKEKLKNSKIVNVVHRDDPLHKVNALTAALFGTRSAGATKLVDYSTPNENTIAYRIAKSMGGFFGLYYGGKQLLEDHSMASMNQYYAARALLESRLNIETTKPEAEIEELEQTKNPWNN